MTPEEKQAIKDRLDAATPGPWHLTCYSGGVSFNGPPRCYKGTNEEFGEPQAMPNTAADHVFVAHAPTDIAALLAYVDELETIANTKCYCCGSHEHICDKFCRCWYKDSKQ